MQMGEFNVLWSFESRSIKSVNNVKKRRVFGEQNIEKQKYVFAITTMLTHACVTVLAAKRVQCSLQMQGGIERAWSKDTTKDERRRNSTQENRDEKQIQCVNKELEK